MSMDDRGRQADQVQIQGPRVQHTHGEHETQACSLTWSPVVPVVLELRLGPRDLVLSRSPVSPPSSTLQSLIILLLVQGSQLKSSLFDLLPTEGALHIVCHINVGFPLCVCSQFYIYF